MDIHEARCGNSVAPFLPFLSDGAVDSLEFRGLDQDSPFAVHLNFTCGHYKAYSGDLTDFVMHVLHGRSCEALHFHHIGVTEHLVILLEECCEGTCIASLEGVREEVLVLGFSEFPVSHKIV